MIDTNHNDRAADKEAESLALLISRREAIERPLDMCTIMDGIEWPMKMRWISLDTLLSSSISLLF
jgi:hypothetical protein